MSLGWCASDWFGGDFWHVPGINDAYDFQKSRQSAPFFRAESMVELVSDRTQAGDGLASRLADLAVFRVASE